MDFLEVAPRLLVATLLGAAVGFERQWRQRMAGLRTNALVALGAASYVVFSLMIDEEISRTRVAAQVVSGIGFLGGGVIIREGLHVRGLNTAATLWCSASVGVFAGAGFYLPGGVAAGTVLLINGLLRPVVGRLDPGHNGDHDGKRGYRVEVCCPQGRAADVRASVVQGLRSGGFELVGVESHDGPQPGAVQIEVRVKGPSDAEEALEAAVGRAGGEPSVTAARWTREDPPQFRLFGKDR